MCSHNAGHISIHGDISRLVAHFTKLLTCFKLGFTLTGGFYTDLLPGSDNHVIMIINSNIWYNYNKEVDGTGDPAHEFQWMEEKLRDAAAKSQKVLRLHIF